MNLSARERQALRSIEGGLTESDPALVAKVARLSRLMADGATPTAERSRAGWRVIISSLFRWLPGSGGRGRTRSHSPWASAIVFLWLAISCALIVTAATLSHGPVSGACGSLVAVPCSSHSQAPQQPGAR